jgi:hypothetical protein
MELLRNIGITLAIATFTGLLQVTLKAISRTPLPKKKTGLTKDDALFWSDWIVAACLALVGSLITSSIADKSIPTMRVAVSVGALLFGCTAFPFLLRLYAYNPRAKLKEWGWKGLGWPMLANSAAMLVLLGAVYTGVSIYEFS